MTAVDRRAGRVLLLDPEGRALLLQGGDPARAGEVWWFTPGGGLNDGETSAEGAARELGEEIGLRVAPAELGPAIWQETVHFSYGGRDYRQAQDFFVLRVPGWQVDMTGMEPDERAAVVAYRWWSVDQIEASAEQIFPTTLATLLRSL